MGFGAAVESGFRKYIVFSGRARRPDYAWWMLFVLAVSFGLGVVDGALFGLRPQSLLGLSGAFALAVLTPTLAVSWRRMHDVGRPGYAIFAPLLCLPLLLIRTLYGEISFGPGLTLYPLIPVLALGLSLLVLFWLASPSEAGPNRYGPAVDAEPLDGRRAE